MEAMEALGSWWVPSLKQKKVAGRLSFSEDDGIRLSLSGSLGVGRARIILGSVSGKPVTLCDCFETRSKGNAVKITAQDFIVDIAFVGAKFTKPDQIRFKKAMFGFTYLPDWVGITGFQTRLQKGGGYNLVYRLPDDISVNLGKDVAALTFGVEYPFAGFTEVTMRQSVFWRLETELASSIDDLLSKYIAPLWNLLRLGSMRENSLTNVFVYIGSDSTKRIQVLFKTGLGDVRRIGQLAPMDMLFSLTDVRDLLDDLLKKWLANHGELTDVVNLLMGAAYGRNIHWRQRFLSLAQAAEGYHRRCCFPKTELPEEAHQKRLEEILAGVSEQHRSWLNDRLRFSNEPNFRRRLKSLVGEASEVVAPMVQRKRDFIQKVYKTRNRLTHPGEGSIAKDEDLFRLTEVLYFLLSACLLGRVGVEKGRLVNWFKRNYRYGRACMNPF